MNTTIVGYLHSVHQCLILPFSHPAWNPPVLTAAGGGSVEIPLFCCGWFP